MRQTSLEAWRGILSTLSARRAEVLAAIIETPGMTAAELESTAMGRRHWNKRLSELERRGLVNAKEARTCAMTGRVALTWWPEDVAEAARRSVMPAPRSFSWKTYAKQLEAQLAQLGAGVSEVAS